MLRTNKFLYIILFVLFIAFSSCAVYYAGKGMHYSNNISSGNVIDKPQLHLVLISQEYDNPYWRLVQQGAREAAQQKGIELEYLGPARADVKEHIKILEMAIASKVDGIITQGLEENEFTPIINEAARMGIPIITVDSDAPHSKRVAYVGTDNYAAGYMAGRELIAKSAGRAEVALITGSFTASNQKDRVRGFKDAVKTYPGIHIIDIAESNISRIQSAASAYTLAQKYPEIDTFVGTSALDGLGIAQMLKEMGSETLKTPIRIIAFDDLPETLTLINQGVIESTIVQQPFIMGRESVNLLMDYLKGEKIVTVYNTDVKVIHREDLTGTGE
ncbi:sugar-binding protein [Paenibacillus sp. JDR-2]|uniref:sugar-binding protein n=1 Tax=Paenibacillus sp. (strain JDR-2) TaxID=324057 RepID=UPI000166A6C3|nr:sugar-binding protein [Paenibacillus sp. JDR-2]ACT00510.1 periplasmic binding protein/LacI transcriptional regulator [Paenibacillus sp. JDR-2]